MLAVTHLLEGSAPVISFVANRYMADILVASVPGRIAASLNAIPNPFPCTVVSAGISELAQGLGGAECFGVLPDRQIG